MMHKYGFVVPTYNDAHFLPDLFHSIMAMTVKPDILTIVDDGSDPDNAEKVAEAAGIIIGIKTQHIRQANGGTFSAINNGIDATDAEWVNGFSADDMVMPSYFEEVSRHEDADVVAIGWRDFGTEREGQGFSPAITIDGLRRGNQICGLSPFKKALWTRIGGFDQSASPCSDYAFWLDACLGGAKFFCSRMILAAVRLRKDSLSKATHEEKQREIVRGILTKRGLPV